MSGPSDHFMARQAILDRSQEVYAYELLYRSSLENFFPAVEADLASSRTVADSFLIFGIEELTGRARAFLNFSRGLLVDGRAQNLPTGKIVIEVLESIQPDAVVVEAVRRLKKMGHTIALDDFVLTPGCEPLLELADIVKVDFRQSPADERASLAELLLPRGITLVAEKVETHEEHLEGLRLGYSLFQGYYFSRPFMISRREIAPNKLHYLRLLQELSSPDLELESLAVLVQSDVSLSVKLLRYINSAATGLRHRVSSIKQALILMGRLEIRRWAGLIALSEVATGKPPELLRLALSRARLCELLAISGGLQRRAPDLFLLGLLSLLDAMLDRPLAEILREMPLESDLQAALLGERNRLGRMLELAMSVERGRWAAAEPLAAELGIDELRVPELAVDALRYPDELWAASAGYEDQEPHSGTLG